MTQSPHSFRSFSCNLLGLLIAATIAWQSGHAEAAEEAGVRDALESAEHAYQQVDFLTVHDEAQRGLTLGHASPEQVSRLYVLLGTAAAALGQEDEAKKSFILALAITPKMNLDRNLSPKLRGPYLEARGYWEAYRDRLSLSVGSSAAGKRVTVNVVDPAHLGQRVVVYVRAIGKTKYRTLDMAAESTTSAALPEDLGREGFEYYARLLDEHDNRTVELGNAASPMFADGSQGSAKGTRKLSAATRELSSDSTEDKSAKPRSYWLPVILGVTGATAAGVGVYFNVKREQYADTWNSSACERPGTTRLGQCGNVDSNRQTAERLAMGLYGAGGLLLVGSVTSWLLSSPKGPMPSPARLACAKLSCPAWVDSSCLSSELILWFRGATEPRNPGSIKLDGHCHKIWALTVGILKLQYVAGPERRIPREVVKDKVPKAVDNWLVVVPLNALRYVRVAANEDVCTGVYESMRELNLITRRERL